MAQELTAAPVLSTPEDHLFEYEKPDTTSANARSDDELRAIYEVERTAQECWNGGKKKIALQFPDHMLGDAPKVVELLQNELAKLSEGKGSSDTDADPVKERIWILADTSYSACCVDEIAAEHADAQVVVHYGRSCLSPTSRLPVIYVFTKHNLDLDAVVQSFETEFSDKNAKIILMADVVYQEHVAGLFERIQARGYNQLLSTKIQHNPLGSIPNRTIIDTQGREVAANEDESIDLKEYCVFHVSSPPTALLLALSSRFASLHIFATSDDSFALHYSPTRTARALLGRRYAKLLNLTTAGIIGILVNTLSVANYLPSIDTIRKQVAEAGKKSYTVVVGKLNPAKLANFSEIEAWVVVGCWESSLVEDDAGFYRPVLTPFELEVALMPDEERIWGLSWWGGIESVKPIEDLASQSKGVAISDSTPAGDSSVEDEDDDANAPVFDLRTGKLVYTARPMRKAAQAQAGADDQDTTHAAGNNQEALTLRPKAELVTINGVLSPGAQYLRSQRTWQGLGTDFDDERAATMEEGRGGIARGYTVGEDAETR
ncbi:putative diphthamide synthesis protein-domain-containing protein [Coniella lustricola]|uniref:2-(3-amino-3-carboxypropyl)histidine synthase subunit 2 n=1 Tax=Coniella lustricola TaxID=2025994 RepID=A0A2T3A4R8_9PEZI|nr:putative diphthamide synthesis protein-domain-containing protein [Coniella lustricola]